MAVEPEQFEVKRGSVTVQVSYAPVTIALKRPDAQAGGPVTVKTYESWQLSFYEGSKRVFRRRKTREKAKKFAEETAERLSTSGAQAEFMPEHDRRIYVHARNVVRPLSLDVDEVCRRYVELQKRIKNGTLEQAVDFFNDQGQRLQLDSATEQIYEIYLKELQDVRGVGKYHLRDTKRYVGNFVKKHPGKIVPITPNQIDDFLRSLGGKACNKNNHRDAIIAFFNFSKKKGFLPYNQPHAAELTSAFTDARREITSKEQALELLKPVDIYTPDEMRKILAKSDLELRPTLEVKAFSGIRTEEIVRLWWPFIAEEEECIKIPDEFGKVSWRRIPILSNLKTRLGAYDNRFKDERVAVNWTTANSLYHAWKRNCDRADVPYKKNAFRNSYFSYRSVILGGDLKTVAAEGGTSEDQLKREYLSKSPISKTQAEDWFTI